MTLDWVRRLCLSLAHTTETVEWGSDLVFKVGGKMYAVTPLEPAPVWLSLKCTPEDFGELTQQPGVIPAPYMARASWIALETEDALPVTLRVGARLAASALTLITDHRACLQPETVSA